jgi:hypothetical protein
MTVYQEWGFDNQEDMLRHVARVEMDTEAKYLRFIRWRDECGMKDGLLEILRLQEESNNDGA